MDRLSTIDAAGQVVTAVVFDIGNVLLKWDPRFLFRELLSDEAAVEHFLTEICPPSWNLEQDRGRSWADGVRIQSELYPEHAPLIEAWNQRWHETVPGPVEGMPALVEELVAAGIPLHIISNFSAEKFNEIRQRYKPLFACFREIVISAHVRLVKPQPEIFEHLLSRTGLKPQACVFVDDIKAYAQAAEQAGMRGLVFRGEAPLRQELIALGLPLERR